jgi:hypothetical protein
LSIFTNKTHKKRSNHNVFCSFEHFHKQNTQKTLKSHVHYCICDTINLSSPGGWW